MLVKTGPSTKRKSRRPVLVLFQHVRAGDVRGHQVGRELDPLELDVEDAGQRADHQRLGQARHAHQQAVAAGEDGGEHLLDHVVLADDDLLQFFLHQPPVLAELLQHVAEVSRFHGGHGERSFGSGVSGRIGASSFSMVSFYSGWQNRPSGCSADGDCRLNCLILRYLWYHSARHVRVVAMPAPAGRGSCRLNCLILRYL